MTDRIIASDLYELTECDRIVFLNHNGDAAQRAAPSAYQEWLRQEGRAFEAQVVQPLAASLPLYRFGDLPGGFAATLALMRGGAQAIYQGVLLDGDRVGLPDILERVEGASNLGDFRYRPLDVKLASESRPGHRWQVMFYAMLLERIQGVRPEGSLLLRLKPDERSDAQLYREEPVAFDAEGFAGALTEVRRLAGGDEPRPFISSTCSGCAWREVCLPIAEASHDVSLLPGLKRKVWAELHARGMGTLAEVAAAEPQALLDIHGVGDRTARDLVTRARALSAGTVVRIAPPPLPPPAADEVFFDVESLPSEGLYYLMGTLVVQGLVRRFRLRHRRAPRGRARHVGGVSGAHGAHAGPGLSLRRLRAHDRQRADRPLRRRPARRCAAGADG